MVPLDTRALQRFYEPIILTKALTNIYRDTGLSRPPDPVTRQETEEERLKSFINRLSNVCDNVKGGTTVSAAAILQDEEGIVYLLASNQVSVSDMMRASELVTRILERIAGVSGLNEGSRGRVKGEVLRMVLVHHWKRVRLYMRALVGNAAHCLTGLGPGSHPDVRDLLTQLAQGQVANAINALDRDELNEETFLETYTNCIGSIRNIQDAPNMLQLIRDRVRQDRSSPLGVKSSDCWSEFRHHMSRLFAYEHTVEGFLDAEAEWPELFQDFDVVVIPSSPPDTKPLGRKSNTASKIIGRMTSDEDQVAKFRAIAAELQKFDLDARINAQISSSAFKPRVHAEVLVLSFITRNCTTFQYFRGVKYIGSSKPTCKLCRYFFDAHPSRVQARASHGNLYKNWKFPPETTRAVYTAVTESVRKDAWQIMKDKAAGWKRHDSDTYSVVTRQTKAIDDLVDKFGPLSLRSGMVDERQEEDLLENEDGGANLD